MQVPLTPGLITGAINSFRDRLYQLERARARANIENQLRRCGRINHRVAPRVLQLYNVTTHRPISPSQKHLIPNKYSQIMVYYYKGH